MMVWSVLMVDCSVRGQCQSQGLGRNGGGYLTALTTVLYNGSDSKAGYFSRTGRRKANEPGMRNSLVSHLGCPYLTGDGHARQGSLAGWTLGYGQYHCLAYHLRRFLADDGSCWFVLMQQQGWPRHLPLVGHCRRNQCHLQGRDQHFSLAKAGQGQRLW
jgi:hypothetical protein